jgi:antitoxin VapB
MSYLISRVFMNGNSQAVRIPQEFRLDTNRVRISRNEAGELVIRPIPVDRGVALLDALAGFDADLTAELVAVLEEDRHEQQPVQERDSL